jgi:hypothetical protein
MVLKTYDKLPLGLMTYILILSIVLTLFSTFINGTPYLFLIFLVLTLTSLVLLPILFFVYWLSNKYVKFRFFADFFGLIILPVSLFWWMFQGSLDCARNISCNLPGVSLVTTPVVVGVIFNYYLIVRFRPRPYVIVISVVFFVLLTITAIYFSPQILPTTDPWRFVG